MAKKPARIVEKERAARAEARRTVWLFGLHAVEAALRNPAREKTRLILTRNAQARLAEAVAGSGLAPEIADPRRFPAPLDPGSVHQGAALEVRPLDWGPWQALCAPGDASPGRTSGSVASEGAAAPRVVLLDRVTDPHNVGAILRSAEVFDARAVLAPARHAAPETGALAKAASGALERQPYLRVPNLAEVMRALSEMGYAVVGLAGEAEQEISEVAAAQAGRPMALALGAEGPGLRALTRARCDALARIGAAGGFGSLNVSNAAAVALYACRDRTG